VAQAQALTVVAVAADLQLLAATHLAQQAAQVETEQTLQHLQLPVMLLALVAVAAEQLQAARLVLVA
jgi:hypothetical protein